MAAPAAPAAAHRHLDFLRGWVPRGSGKAARPAAAGRGDSWFSTWGARPSESSSAGSWGGVAERQRASAPAAAAAGSGGDSWYQTWVTGE